MEEEKIDELEVSELEFLSSFSVEDVDAIDEPSCSFWNIMTLVGGHSLSNED